MSAEKDIVNFWLNKKGLFTINNIKAFNRDLGIVALKFDKDKVKEIAHYEILCSLTGNIQSQNSFEKIINEKFSGKSVQKAIKRYLEQFSLKESNEFIVLSNISNKNIIKKFKDNNVEVIEFENVLADVINELDTQYYKNDTIRSLQLVKYMLFANPKNMASALINVLNQNEKKDFMKELLENDEIIKEFRKTNEERLAEILKYSFKNPKKLAELLENNILNRKTRKPFLSSLLEQRKMKRVYKEFAPRKKEASLSKFF
ncbi:hypothetical protein J4458_04820 [Candidatus Woesearchaeota archaeon]|nr:hypothetical protein [Candidatus Woesearchaeota archaeon]